ncbi:MAG TPA: type II secretion system protein, partial [Pirellulales bacterium]|nr:type II secretion system protein [Pirellulales bacterium]
LTRSPRRRPPSPQGRGARRRAFTLIEMLVVLAILAALTLVAVQSLVPLADQARTDATIKSLKSVDDAVLGPSNARNPDGTPLVTGFVADVGRLPIIHNDGYTDVNGNPDYLGELRDTNYWQSAGFTTGFRQGPSTYTCSYTGTYNGIAVATAITATLSTVGFTCGWNGPYVLPGIEYSSNNSYTSPLGVTDGFGNDFILATQDNLTITTLMSSSFSGGASIPLQRPFTSGLVTVSGMVLDGNTGAALADECAAFLLYPAPSLSTITLSVAACPMLPTSTTSSISGPFTFYNVPVGFRAIVVATATTSRTTTTYVNVPFSGLSNVTITLPSTSTKSQ